MKSLLCLYVVLWSMTLSASELSYVKTDTPRDTMETFIKAMNDYRIGVVEDLPKKKARIFDAIRCFSETNNKVIVSQHEKEQAAIFLKEAIDRVIVVDLKLVPSTTTDNRWRLKNTEVVLKKQSEGEREGEWLITEGTWKRSAQFFQRVRDLPYLEGSGQGAAYIQPWMETYLPDWSKEEHFGLKNWQWLGIAAGLFLGLLLRLLSSIVFVIYQSLSFAKRYNWKTDLLKKLERPLSLLVAAGFWYMWIFYLNLEGLAFSLVNGLIQIVFGFAITWVAYQVVSVLSFYLKERAEKTTTELDDQLVPFLEKTLKLLVVLLGFLLILQNMGVNVFSLLAGLGLGGLAFALAAKDTAANLFGSIMILVDRPFKIGDWVKLADVEGTIEEIGFRSTRIRTFYNSLITVPNATVANADIDNLGARLYRRTSMTLDVTYQTTPEQLKQFIEGIRSIIEAHPITRKDLYHVYFSGYGDSSLKILVYFFLITNDWGEELKERQNIFLEIFELAEELGVEFAYPTQTLFLNQEEQKNKGDSLESP